MKQVFILYSYFGSTFDTKLSNRSESNIAINIFYNSRNDLRKSYCFTYVIKYIDK